MYRCIDVYMYICIYICIYMYICVYIYMCVYIYVYMCICIYAYMHICIYAYIFDRERERGDCSWIFLFFVVSYSCLSTNCSQACPLIYLLVVLVPWLIYRHLYILYVSFILPWKTRPRSFRRHRCMPKTLGAQASKYELRETASIWQTDMANTDPQ